MRRWVLLHQLASNFERFGVRVRRFSQFPASSRTPDRGCSAYSPSPVTLPGIASQARAESRALPRIIATACCGRESAWRRPRLSNVLANSG